MSNSSSSRDRIVPLVRNRGLAVVLTVLLGAAALYASFPGITYDMWVDFEQAALNVAPTTATLASSTHGTAGTWRISNPNGALTVVSKAQDGLTGATGTRGLQYSDASGRVNYLSWNLPSAKSSVSLGLWYCTSNQSSSAYNYEEGPHFVGFSNNATGDLWRLSDERSSYDNTRWIRLSPSSQPNNRAIPVSDNTCYWIAFKYVAGGTTTFNLYDTNLNLLGSVNSAGTGISETVNVNSIFLGNDQKTTGNLAYTIQIDDVMVDYTAANFPLLPNNTPPTAGAVPTIGQNAQHTSGYTPAPQDLASVHWSAPLNSGPSSTAHLASPVITPANTVVVPARTAANGFQLSAYAGPNGAPLYTLNTDYVLPTADWIPVYQPVLTMVGSTTRLYYPCAGGTVCYISNPDATSPGTVVRQVFYTTLSDYQSRAASFNSTVFINTPITADSNGNIFYGFRVQGTAPSPLSTSQDGFVRIDPNGNATYVLASVAAGDTAIGRDSHNSAPALSNDQSTLYVVAKSSNTEYYGYLIGLNSTTLATKYKVLLTDPVSGSDAGILDDSTASPTVGPDNDVYFGVAANPDNGSRGYLLHFSGDLSTRKTPGAYGWDTTASIVPASAVPSYTGTSSYLLLCNYNNFAGLGDGNGVNRLALLDAGATQVDPHTSANGLVEMREVLTVAGPTPDANNVSLGSVNAVLPWQTNAMAVSASATSVFAVASDGRLYRWDLSKNSLGQFLNLGAASSQPNVPAAIGPDGTVFAINGTTLYALGNVSGVSVRVTSSIADDRSVSAGQSLTLTATVARTGTGSLTPTGTVTFSDTTYSVTGSTLTPTTTQLATVSLSSGQASLSSSSLTAGTHFISAAYSGDSNFAAATGSFVQVIHANATNTSLVATPSLSSLGQAVTLTAAATPIPSGAGTPTGMMLFKVGNTILGQAPLDSAGQAAFTTTTLPAGNNTITAVYSSDSTFASSQGTATATVVSTLNTSVNVAASPNPSSAGQTVTITATVSSTGGTPTGSITFLDGGTTLTSNVNVNSNGVATYTTSSLSVGTHTISASFTGTGGWLNSSGSTSMQVVQSGFLTSTAATSAPNPSTFGQSVTVTATVTSTGGVPTGAVTFVDGSTTLASNVTVNGSGQAIYTTTMLAVGSHTITANFVGTGGFANSTGTSSPQVVQSASGGFPGITYDMWIDFEQCAVAAKPTASCLASSTHGTAGTWSTSSDAGGNSLTIQSAAQDTVSGAPGSRGLQYNTSNIIVSYDTWAPPSAKTQMSVGFWMKTSTQPTSGYGYAEGPHFFGFASDAQGDLWRLSDERDGATNNRQIRISPGSGSGKAVTVADGTMYWVTFKMVKNGLVQLSVYDTKLNLVGTASLSDTDNTNIDYIWLGNDLTQNPALAYTELLDDLIVDYTNAKFPLLPATSNATVTSATATPNPATVGQSVTITATVSSTGGVPTGTVTFTDGGTTLASNVAVNGSGQAAYTTTGLAAGTHTITATYTATGGFGNSAGTVTETVNPVPTATTTAVASSPNPSAFGQTVTITATVTSSGGTPTGTVTFMDGSTTLASNVAVNGSGQASFTTTSLAVGSHAIAANFTGSGSFANSSGTTTQTVNAAATTTAVSGSPNPSTSGQSVTFTATVTSTAGTPTGSVTFLDGSTTLASNVAINGSGQATYATTALAVGSHTITANFTGTGNFGNSSGTAAQTVNAAAIVTTTAVASSVNPSTFGQSVTLTATVTATSGTPTGTVTFSDGSTTLASNVAVNGSGQATYTSSSLAVGSHTITASFTGTGGFGNSSGTVAQTVNTAATTTAVAATPNPSSFGQSVTISANVASSGGTPTGTVTFMDGSTTLVSNVAVNGSGMATYTTTTLAVGSHTITASFTGTGNFGNSSGTFTQTVNTAATTTAVAATPNPSSFGQSVTITATVASSGGTPTGTVTFMDGSTTLASGVALNGSGQASFTTASLAVGSHAIAANFTGSGNFGNSSGTTTQTVNAAATTTAVSGSPNPSTSGQSVTFTATVTSTAGTPTGSVTFLDGSTTLASNVAINGSGQAVYTTTALAIGAHTITASFAGTGNFASSSGATTQTVNSASTTTAVAITPNPSTFGQSVTITATVTSTGGTPTGTVTFMDGSTTLASNVAVNGSGQATYSTASLAAGSHTITANFTGTSGFGNSSGTSVQVVNALATATTAAATPNPSTFGQSVTITAMVSSTGGTPTGTVTFMDGSTTLASNVAVNGSGLATYTTTTLSVGSHTITANFTGTGGFGNSSGTVSQTVNVAVTTTAVAATPNPSTFGQSVTLTATISSTGGTPTGTVTFMDGANILAPNVAVNGSAQATFTTAGLAFGSHAITANFTGSGNFGNSSGTTTQTVNAAATTTAVAAMPNPSTVGQSVTITATVTSTGGVPAGTVTFTDGGTTLASNVAVNGSGQAAYTTTGLAVGTHTITATFTGSGNFANSAGTVVQTVNPVPIVTATAVTSTPNPSTLGQSVTITATVTSTGGIPTGTVTFSDGSTTLASNVAVNGSGQASYATTTLGVGSHTITAAFTGTGAYANSSGTSAPQVVQGVVSGFPGISYDMWIDFEQCAIGAAPTASCLASSTHGTAGTWSTANDKGGSSLTVQSNAQDTLSGAPGNRGFQYNTSNIIVSYDTWAPPASKTQMSVGFWMTTSTQPTSGYGYAEGPHFFGFSSQSQGDLWRLSDERDSATNNRQIRLSPGSGSGTSVVVADATTYWVTFKMVKGGPVQLRVYDTKLNLVGSVSFTDTINSSIDYIWIGNDQTESPALAYTELLDDLMVDYTNAAFPLLPVISNATVSVLAATPNPSTPGQPVTITATVTAAGGTPTGAVTFMDGSTTLASNIPLDGNGHAAFTTSSLALGTHAIATSFTGTNGWYNSSGTLSVQVVQPDHLTTTAVSSSQNPSTFGQPVTLTATVTAPGGTPTGTLTFMDGSTTLASNVSVSGSGQATYTTTTLAAGNHTISANLAATGGYGNSSGTIGQTVQADTVAPSQPTGVTATSGPGTAQISIAWSPSTDNVGVTGYQVWRASSANGTYSRITTTTTTSYVDTQTRSGVTRYYYIIAQDAAGNVSTRSATVSAVSK